MQTLRRISATTLAILLLSLGCSCSSTCMKGTPFYTGEYTVNTPPEDRVNLWPLLYYHDPALSILWPFIEISDTHIAARPLFSIYGRNQKHPTYNFLWPLSSFNTTTGDSRVFPFFWGKDYRVVFPLYWHYDSPLKHNGSDTFFPLWQYSSHGKDDYDIHLIWPFLNIERHGPDSHGWRVWPLAGSYHRKKSIYRFALWPLGHQWDTPDYSGSALIPLYLHQESEYQSRFLSLLYSQGSDHDTSWNLLLPIFYRYKSNSHRKFFSLLYSSGKNMLNKSNWSLAVPLWYKNSTPNSSLTATLLGGIKSNAEQTSWLALPLLSGGSYDATDSDLWLLGPLAHFQKTTATSQQHIFPLYYRETTAAATNFYSLPWSSSRKADGTSWQLLPPLFYHSASPGGHTTITPLYAHGKESNTAWHAVMPLYLNRDTQDGNLLATPLGGWKQHDNGDLSWLALPLLSGGHTSHAESSFWALAPLIHASWNENYSSHHILPFYYWNGRSRNLISLPYTRWHTPQSSATIIPPLLSWKTASPQRSDLWLLGPLAHFSSGKNAGSNHILPLYYHNSRNGNTITPLYANLHEPDNTDTRIYPPLLSMYKRNQDSSDTYALAGLYHHHSSTNQISDRLFPLWSYAQNKHLYSLLYGWRKGDNGFFYPLTPLAGVYRGNFSGNWFFPLWSHRRNRKSGDVSANILWGGWSHSADTFKSGFFPLFGYRSTPSSRRFLSLPSCWYSRDTVSFGNHSTKRMSAGIFPLWSKSHKKTVACGRTNETAKASLMLFLYDSSRKSTAATDNTPATDYTRRRILWRVWHYEKLNDDVSVDIFPAITYDRRSNGFHKFSFLWRFIRYENGPKGKKFDLFFIPVLRSKPPKQ